MMSIPNDVKHLMSESPCDGPYTIKLVGEIDGAFVYLQVPKYYQGCVGYPTYVLFKNGTARYATEDETLFCMGHFSKE